MRTEFLLLIATWKEATEVFRRMDYTEVVYHLTRGLRCNATLRNYLRELADQRDVEGMLWLAQVCGALGLTRFGQSEPE